MPTIRYEMVDLGGARLAAKLGDTSAGRDRLKGEACIGTQLYCAAQYPVRVRTTTSGRFLTSMRIAWNRPGSLLGGWKLTMYWRWTSAPIAWTASSSASLRR